MKRFTAIVASVVLACILLPELARAQEWTDTRVGAYDFICESLPAGSPAGTIGTLVSGHQRFSLAARACAAAAKADPALSYQVRPATYRIALVAPASSPPPPAPEVAAALALDPTCAAVQNFQSDVTIGTALANAPLRACLSGTDAAAAVFSISPAPAAGTWAISGDGAVSHSGGGPAAAGTFTVRATSSGGAFIGFDVSWRVHP